MVSSKCWPTALLPNLPEIQPLLNSHFIFLPSETKAVGVRPICLRHYKHKLWEYYCHFKLFNIAIEIMNKYPIFILKRNKCFIFYNTEIIFIKQIFYDSISYQSICDPSTAAWLRRRISRSRCARSSTFAGWITWTSWTWFGLYQGLSVLKVVRHQTPAKFLCLWSSKH